MSETAREIRGDVSPTQAISALDLRMMPRDELVALYHLLEAPPFEEMHGEFAASLLDQGSTRGFLLSAFALNMSGRWFGKAFEPTGPKEGHGYNNFMTPRGVRRSWRMRTQMGPSKLPNDTKDAFHLEYSHFNDFKRGGLVGAQLHTVSRQLNSDTKGL